MADQQGPLFSNPWEAPVSRNLPDVPDSRIAHTLTACTRCRQRKSRCDPGIPRCEPCERSNAKCVYFDPTRNDTIPRTYILQLREKARQLEEQIANVENEIKHAADAELMVRGAGRIKFNQNDEPRYLGPSSGIAIARLVMELAKQNTDSKSIKAVVPEIKAQEIKDRFEQESLKPTSKIYPIISSIPQPNLPNRYVTDRLIDYFMVKAMLPTLHEPTFRQDVEDVFNGSIDPCQNFQLRLVIAISMQKHNTTFAGLADSYYLAALPFLEDSIRKMDLSTLQCLVLICQYSLLTPTRTASYWVVGFAVKLCQELGLTEEATITKSQNGNPLNPLELDMRRRLFWIVTSLEYGLSHSLGRPSSFCVTHDHIDVNFFALVDDRYITPQGILPQGRSILLKCIAIHFFRMRLLQAEIRRTLYLKKRETPIDDSDPWFTQMLAKLDHWVASCPKQDGGTGLSEKWFKGRRNTMIVFLFRPSPQVPEPSLYAAQMCYDASAFNVAMHREQIRTNSVDLTWIFTQSVFMALNTLLWSLSYPDIRREHPIDEVKIHLRTALEGMALAAERWPGVESAIRLYESLISACLKAYDSEESFVVHSPPSSQASPPSVRDSATPPIVSSPSSTTATSFYSTQTVRSSGLSATDAESCGTASRGQSLEPPNQFHQASPALGPVVPSVEAVEQSQLPQAVDQQPDLHQSPPQPTPEPLYDPQPYIAASTLDQELRIDPTTPFNAFPSVLHGLPGWDPNYTAASTTASHLAYVNASVDPMLWLGSIGDQYSQYSHQPFPVAPWRERTLSQQEQIELMACLEENIPDVSSHLVNESATFYVA